MKDFDKKEREQLAETVFDKHRDAVDACEAAPQAESVKPTSEAIIAMGAMLDRADEMAEIVEAGTTVNGLGRAIRNIMKPVIVGSIATSPIAAISNIQAIDSRVSSIFVRKVKASNTRGNLTAGAVIADPYTLEAPIDGYASGEITDLNAAAYAIGATAIAFTLSNAPAVKGSVQLVASGITFVDSPDGNGESIGGNGSNTGRLINKNAASADFGTINYLTGAITITLAVAAAANGAVIVTWAQELDQATTLPELELEFSEIPVIAKERALAISTGFFASIEAKRKFGAELEPMLAREATAAINAETFQAGMNSIKTSLAARPVTNFVQPTAALTGVTRAEQITSEWRKFLLSIETSSYGFSGGFQVTSMVCGRDLAAMIMEHPKFVRNRGAMLQSAHVIGTLDGVVIVREPRISVLPAASGYALTKGQDFLATSYYAPYLPITALGAVRDFANPLRQKQALATSNGFFASTLGARIALV